jgi:hypothetical protein
VAIIGLSGCNVTKRLGEDEVLLRRNKIEIEGDAKPDRESLSETLRQQPNRRVLNVFPLYLWAYNVPNPAKAEARNTKRLNKADIRNEKRIANGKATIAAKPWGSWWQETVGEPPVILDTALTQKSNEQLSIWLIKHGWFQNKVESRVEPAGRKKAKVIYTIHPGPAYSIEEIEYKIPDEYLLNLTKASRENGAIVKTGEQFNIEKLDEERTELNSYFRNRGFYDFNKELIYFDVDTALGRHAVHLTLGIIPRKIPYSGDPDSLLIVPYRRFTVDRIVIEDRPAERNTIITASDTTLLKDYIFVDNHFVNIKSRVLAQNVLFNTGSIYNIDRVTKTYRRMSALPAIRSTAVQFEPASDSQDNTSLLCKISLTPAPKQNVSLEGRGTNRGGFLGIAGSISFTNRNIFGGGEQLRINLAGGIEAQQLLTGSANTQDGPVQGAGRIFNTVEFGPEVSLTFPKFLLPVSSERFAKSAAPRTTLLTNLSYQRRPDYERTRSFGSIAYHWLDSDNKQWVVAPVEVSLIKINKSDQFIQQLEDIGDPFLINSFNDHFILGSRIGYTYTSQRPGVRQKNAYFFRSDLQAAGNVLRGIFQISDIQPDESGSYEVLGIKFAQYIKATQEFRYHRIHNEKMTTAYRATGGIGVPFGNLNVLPFEKSYFGGGANDMRAWQARTLGPGSFRDPERNFDKIGDILLGGNVEYRFDLVDVLEGALFVDAGNIWTLRSDEARPGADFQFNRFLTEIAVGAGVGMRLNFDFFLIRLDLGLQLKDPSLDRGERWLFQSKTAYNQYIDLQNESRPDNPLPYYGWRMNLNLGIGYPF